MDIATKMQISPILHTNPLLCFFLNVCVNKTLLQGAN